MDPQGGPVKPQPEPERASASEVLDLLVDLGATHLLGIPDNGSAPLFDLTEEDPRITSLIVTREGEAFSIAAGLWIGGMRPVVSIQNTGFIESGDALRGTVTRLGMPLLCLVGYRGFAKMVGAGLDPQTPATEREVVERTTADMRSGNSGTASNRIKNRLPRKHPTRDPLTRDQVTRADVDSVALMTEPTLEAWGIAHRRFYGRGELPAIRDAWDWAEREQRPAAILMTTGLT